MRLLFRGWIDFHLSTYFAPGDADQLALADHLRTMLDIQPCQSVGYTYARSRESVLKVLRDGEKSMFRVNRIAIGLCSLGVAATYPFAASGQTSSDGSSVNPLPSAEQSITWEKLPKNHELSFYEPERAQRMAQNGDSSMRCELVGAGTLTTCAVIAENPADFGFGAAILKLISFFKATPSAQDRAVLISVHWSYRGGSTLSTQVALPPG